MNAEKFLGSLRATKVYRPRDVRFQDHETREIGEPDSVIRIGIELISKELFFERASSRNRAQVPVLAGRPGVERKITPAKVTGPDCFGVVISGVLSMGYAHVGRTGLKVSRLALGRMNFGELTDEAASFSIMDEALDDGINLFDTADVYGGPQSPSMEKGSGISKETICRWLAQGRRRERIVLATKVYQPMATGPLGLVSEQSLYNLAERTIECPGGEAPQAYAW